MAIERALRRAPAALRILGGVLIALSMGVTPAHADVTVGATGSSNLIPFGTSGGANTYTGPYQQVYASSAFPGPLTITSIGFQSSDTSTVGAYEFTGTLGLAVSNTVTPLSPGTTYIATTPVFGGSQGAVIAADGTFDLVFPLAVPFDYNPALGNLVLGVDTASATSAGDVEFVFGFSSDVGRTINSAPAEAFAESGLLTRFETQSTVPEPSTLLLLGTVAVTASAFALRRRP